MNLTANDIKGCLFLVIFSTTAAFLFNQFSPRGIALFGQWEAEKGVLTANSKANTVDHSIEINHPERIRQVVEKKERMILDVRHKDFYDMGRLPGALSFPLSDWDRNVSRLADTIKKNTPLLVYCSGFDCDASHTVANRLAALNYTDVKVFPGGFDQWEQMGFEIEKSEE